MSKAKNKIPADLMAVLEKADSERGFPKGTMASVMQQETGGQFDKFLGDPSAYHYGLDAKGRRVAGHTGKISTAFGPFGILESTGSQPGYGVKPLGSKDLMEQVRFAADYLKARSKHAGGLEKGLAGYGEGGKYGSQVMSRINGNAQVRHSEMKAKAASIPTTQQAQTVAPVDSIMESWNNLGPAAAAVQAVPAVQVAGVPASEKTWEEFVNRMPEQAAIAPSMLNYGVQNMAQVVVPDFMASVGQQQTQRKKPMAQGFGSDWATV